MPSLLHLRPGSLRPSMRPVPALLAVLTILGVFSAQTPLHADGWITIAGLAPAPDVRGEASRLNCSHCWHNGKILSLNDRGGDAPTET